MYVSWIFGTPNQKRKYLKDTTWIYEELRAALISLNFDCPIISLTFCYRISGLVYFLKFMRINSDQSSCFTPVGSKALPPPHPQLSPFLIHSRKHCQNFKKIKIKKVQILHTLKIFKHSSKDTKLSNILYI